MEFEKVEIEGLILCKPKLINDSRGFFSESYRKDLLESVIEQKINFCQLYINTLNLWPIKSSLCTKNIYSLLS